VVFSLLLKTEHFTIHGEDIQLPNDAVVRKSVKIVDRMFCHSCHDMYS